jgi:hypothetical protein
MVAADRAIGRYLFDTRCAGNQLTARGDDDKKKDKRKDDGWNRFFLKGDSCHSAEWLSRVMCLCPQDWQGDYTLRVLAI